MSRTMTANIPGARLREVERQLATLRGEEAINRYIEEHPNEVQVLEQMVAARRAGKPTPSLTRVQRVMLWSDGEVEFKTDPVPEGREREGRRERGGLARSGAPRSAGRAPREASAGRGPDARGATPRTGPRSAGRGPQRRGGGGRGRPGEGGAERGVPRSGEGWILLREGEKPPEPEPLPEYDWDDSETLPRATEAPDQELKAPAAEAAGAESESS